MNLTLEMRGYYKSPLKRVVTFFVQCPRKPLTHRCARVFGSSGNVVCASAANIMGFHLG